jgi:hypothetical protein
MECLLANAPQEKVAGGAGKPEENIPSLLLQDYET